MDKQYNIFLRNYTILEEGEQFCSKCKGKGKVPQYLTVPHLEMKMLRCDKCNGDGKIDWIEKITGKKVTFIGYTFDAEL